MNRYLCLVRVVFCSKSIMYELLSFFKHASDIYCDLFISFDTKQFDKIPF